MTHRIDTIDTHKYSHGSYLSMGRVRLGPKLSTFGGSVQLWVTDLVKIVYLFVLTGTKNANW